MMDNDHDTDTVIADSDSTDKTMTMTTNQYLINHPMNMMHQLSYLQTIGVTNLLTLNWPIRWILSDTDHDFGKMIVRGYHDHKYG